MADSTLSPSAKPQPTACYGASTSVSKPNSKYICSPSDRQQLFLVLDICYDTLTRGLPNARPSFFPFAVLGISFYIVSSLRRSGTVCEALGPTFYRPLTEDEGVRGSVWVLQENFPGRRGRRPILSDSSNALFLVLGPQRSEVALQPRKKEKKHDNRICSRIGHHPEPHVTLQYVIMTGLTA